MDLLLLNNIHTTSSSVNYNKQMKDYQFPENIHINNHITIHKKNTIFISFLRMAP